MLISRTSIARLLGYAILGGALVAAVMFAAFVVSEIARPDRIVRVEFPEIATLSEGDPVVENGVEVGKVRSIRLAPPPARARVELELFHHRPLSRDTRFVNFSHSLMGARKVWVVPGSLNPSRDPLDESGVQAGLFAPGLAETLHKVDSLTLRVAGLRAETERLLTGDNPVLAPLEAQRRLEAAARSFDALAAKLGDAQASLGSGLGRLQSFARTLDRDAREAGPRLDTAFARADLLLGSVRRVQNDLDTALARAAALAAMARDSAGAGRLLHDDAAYVRLRQSVRLLEQATRLLQKDGLGDSVKIKPRLRG
jgi:ABC-type transporter Mla subunit MlaD